MLYFPETLLEKYMFQKRALYLQNIMKFLDKMIYISDGYNTTVKSFILYTHENYTNTVSVSWAKNRRMLLENISIVFFKNMRYIPKLLTIKYPKRNEQKQTKHI